MSMKESRISSCFQILLITLLFLTGSTCISVADPNTLPGHFHVRPLYDDLDVLAQAVCQANTAQELFAYAIPTNRQKTCTDICHEKTDDFRQDQGDKYIW